MILACLMRLLFFLLSLIAVLAALGWYVFVQQLACAYATTSVAGCSVVMPWDLGGEDFIVLTGPLLISLLALVVSVRVAFLRPKAKDTAEN